MMKKLAIILTLTIALVQVQAFADSANNKQAAKKTTASSAKGSTAVRTNDNKAYPTSGSDFLLKYNVDDLEAAPWLHSGKRVYK